MAEEEVRRLRRDLKLANRERGKQGQTIFELRNEIAGLRQRLRELGPVKHAYYELISAEDDLIGEDDRLVSYAPSKVEGLV